MANMNGVRFTGEFINCIFTAAEFRYARFIGATFKNCSFIGVSFKDAAIRTCTFNGCDFAGASFDNTSGTTTCYFDRDCKGLFETKGDIEVETKFCPNGGSYNVYPKSLRHLYSLSIDKTSIYADEGEFMSVSENIGDDILVAPESLPEVSHYRSAPSQILKSDEMSEAEKKDNKADWDEEEYYACGWHNWLPDDKEKHRYGYGTNAVLECPDIEEFRKWKT